MQQQPHTYLNLAAAYRSCAHSFWLWACFSGLAFAACSSRGADGNPETGSAASPGTFAAAAGPLCAKRADSSSNTCIQPTSSSTGEAALLQTIIGPGGPVIEFDSMGLTENTIYVYSTAGHSATTPSYGMARRRILAGGDGFDVDGRRYGNARTIAATGIRMYGNDGKDAAITLYTGTGQDHQEGGRGPLAEARIISRAGTMPNMRSEISSWITMFRTCSLSSRETRKCPFGMGCKARRAAHSPSYGQVPQRRRPPEGAFARPRMDSEHVLRLLTDQADAPQARKVTYVGSVRSWAGPGERLNEHTSDTLHAGFVYEAVLDTLTGKLSGVRIDDTAPETRMRMRLELPELRFQNSRLDDASRKQRIRVRLEGPGEDLRPAAPLPDTARSQHEFTTDGLEAEISGKQAGHILIIGAGLGVVSRLILPVAGTTGGPQRGVAPPRHSCGYDSSARLALQPASGTINRQFRRDTTPGRSGSGADAQRPGGQRFATTHSPMIR